MKRITTGVTNGTIPSAKGFADDRRTLVAIVVDTKNAAMTVRASTPVLCSRRSKADSIADIGETATVAAIRPLYIPPPSALNKLSQIGASNTYRIPRPGPPTTASHRRRWTVDELRSDELRIKEVKPVTITKFITETKLRATAKLPKFAELTLRAVMAE